ncbi:MAG: nucleotidyl transferase AbiEii/AbiGii toxin family protein, partial [Gammaproteobacteria bacterium]|nr:nucleotidyl transferase AbiEii/AbiGii toxin family protein [Gammaproteobacteria bacterium]
MTYDLLFKSQDTILQQIFTVERALLPGSTLILAGGTALARCHLHHRISWDLDFFADESFDPAVLLRRLRDAGVSLEDLSQEVGGAFATQLHGSAELGGEVIKLSFVEDVFAGMFDTTRCGVIRT